MAKAFDTWTVLEHEPINKLAENLWCVSGALPGMPLRRTMSVVRLPDGRLIIHNAIALEDAAMAELEAWGTPAFIVVPNGWHRLDSKVFKERYPEAWLVCPRGASKKVSEVVSPDATYGDVSFGESAELMHVEGIGDAEGVLEVRSSDGTTLIFNDLLFNVPHQPGVAGLVFKLIGSTGGPKVTRVMRLAAVKQKAALRAHLERLADIPDLVRLIPGHGDIISANAPMVLGNVAGAL